MYFYTADIKDLWEAMLRDGDWEGLDQVRVQGFLTLQYDIIHKYVGL